MQRDVGHWREERQSAERKGKGKEGCWREMDETGWGRGEKT